MICKNCNKIVFRKNRNGLCFTCYTGQPVKEKLLISQKTWKKFNLHTQEGLSKKMEVVFDDSKPELHGKQRVINFLNKIDFTTKEGQKNFDKYLGYVELGSKKFDDIMDKIDKGFGKMESGISNIHVKGSGRKSIIDGDIGGDMFKGKPII